MFFSFKVIYRSNEINIGVVIKNKLNLLRYFSYNYEYFNINVHSHV